MSEFLSRFLPEFVDDEIEQIQLKALHLTLDHVLENSPQYQKKLTGVNARDIKSLDDIQHLPFTTTDDLSAGYPFPLLSVPEQDIVRVHASSGTTGKRKILAYSERDVDVFSLQMARCYEMAGLTPLDRIQIAVGYGLWTAGAGFQLGAEYFGAMAVPVGPGNLDIQMQLLEDLQVTCLGCTASMALLLAEEVDRLNLRKKLNLKRIIFGSEPSSDKMRANIKEKLGLEDCFDIAGMTEMYGPGTGIDCEAHEGIHYWPDLFYIEIINPETLKPVAMGEMGEMVVTSLCKEASPLIRYRTRDLTRLLPGICSCGRNIPRHDRFLGRSDDMIIFKGVNIYPGQISDVIQEYPELDGEYQIELSRVDSREYMKINLERKANISKDDDQNLAQNVSNRLHKKILAKIEVKIVDYASLPRTFSKSKRVIDKRDI